jgi:hypothetical protein
LVEHYGRALRSGASAHVGKFNLINGAELVIVPRATSRGVETT